MRRVPLAAGLCLTLFLAGCGEKPSTLEEVNSTEVSFPNGTKILAEPMQRKMDMTRGMMFRDSLGAHSGMLFMYGKEDRIPFWTFQVRIPLDIIWLDHQHRVVEMSLNAAPCTSQRSEVCPSYGGHEKAQFVLEINGGLATKNQLKVGDLVDF